MEELANKLIEELECDVVFTIPVFGGIDVLESVVVTWIIMAALVLASILLTRNLKLQPAGRRQILLEVAIGGIKNFFEGILGEHGKRYIPYLGSVGIYIGISNLIGLLGFKPPTKDLNVTVALALMSIILIEYAGIRQKGLRGFFKGLAQPMAVMAPFNIMEIVIKPLALCMRLFGNVLGAFVIMELIKLILPVALPVPFSLYFDIFDGLIQTYVFVFLTAMFMREAME